MAHARTAILAAWFALAPALAYGTPVTAGPVAVEGLEQAPQPPYHSSPEEQAFLDQLERDTFQYFWMATPAASGLTPDQSPGSDVSSVAGVGFALTAYPVGVERGYVSRTDAAARTLATLRTLWQASQGPAPEGAAGDHGFFYHFLDGRDGQRTWQSELSTIDTALLMAGVLTAEAYFDGTSEVERSIRELSDQLYRRVDWTWAYSPRNRPLLSMGWSPENGFLDYDWRGYNEGMLLYLLALGSPTHPIDAKAWEAWTRSYRWESPGGLPQVVFGPLFGHQYPHVWIDFRGIQDPYMQARHSDYFINSVRATYANRAYCIANPRRWNGYGELVWGLTASQGPYDPTAGASPALAPFHPYWARGASPDGSRDDGTIAPTAVGGSVPFAPELAIPALLNLRERFGDRLYGKYGFKDAFNLSYPGKAGGPPGWFAGEYLAIDQGPILLMIENYRSGLVWNLLKKSPYLATGLRRAGFTGGWLATAPGAAAPSVATTTEPPKSAAGAATPSVPAGAAAPSVADVTEAPRSAAGAEGSSTAAGGIPAGSDQATAP